MLVVSLGARASCTSRVSRSICARISELWPSSACWKTSPSTTSIELRIVSPLKTIAHADQISEDQAARLASPSSAQIAAGVTRHSPGRQSWSKYGLAMRKLCRKRTWGPPARPPSRPALRSRSGEPRQVGSVGAVRRRKCRPQVLSQRQVLQVRAACAPRCRATATGHAQKPDSARQAPSFAAVAWRLREHMYLYLPKRMIQIRRSKHRRLTSGQECESGKHASARAVFFSKIR